MKFLTSTEFCDHVDKYPSWAATFTEPVQITDFCNMFNSPITHLSPHLHFVGLDEHGRCADFTLCESLTVAEGVFSGAVTFAYSAVSKIGDLFIKKAEKSGDAVDFSNCNNLRVATGNYPGAANFCGSGVKRIDELTIQKPNKDGLAADFYYCKYLEHAEGYYPGHVYFNASGIERIGILDARSANFAGCDELSDAANPAKWLDNPHAAFDPETRSRLEAIRNL